MRIVHVINSMDPSQGGPPSAVAGLAAAQASLGHDVGIFYYKTLGIEDKAYRSLYDIPSFSKVEMISCQKHGVIDDVFGFSAKRYLKDLIQNVDIVHIHGLWRPMLKLAARIAKQYGLRYVVTPHGMLTPWSLYQKRRKKQIAMLLGWRKFLQEAAFLNMLSDEESSLSVVKNVSTKIEIISNGVFIRKQNEIPVKGSFFEEFTNFDSRPYILFLGRLHHVKGIDYLIDAFEKITKVNDTVDLVIAGPDCGEKNTLMKEVVRKELQQRIHFVGPLYGESKYKALGDALCLCQPSRQEGFSMTITEAMAMGLPVVITETCRFPDVAELGAGEVVGLDSIAICLALLRMINDTEWRQKAGQAAKDLVIKRYTWPSIAEKFVSAYDNVI